MSKGLFPGPAGGRHIVDHYGVVGDDEIVVEGTVVVDDDVENAARNLAKRQVTTALYLRIEHYPQVMWVCCCLLDRDDANIPRNSQAANGLVDFGAKDVEGDDKREDRADLDRALVHCCVVDTMVRWKSMEDGLRSLRSQRHIGDSYRHMQDTPKSVQKIPLGHCILPEEVGIEKAEEDMGHGVRNVPVAVMLGWSELL